MKQVGKYLTAVVERNVSSTDPRQAQFVVGGD